MLQALSRVRLALALSLCLVWMPSRGAAAPKEAAVKEAQEKTIETKKVKFETVDQVDLQGTFYPSSKGKTAPCVLLLHKIGGNSQQEGWDKLAEELQKKDFAVLSFDFRGHGNSTAVGQGFWTLPSNRSYVKGYQPANPKVTINDKDFVKSYAPFLVNDIAAAKLFLDRKNDAGECNSANLILIGAEDGATLGALWMYSEFYRYKVATSSVPPKLYPTPEGKHIAGAVWLSISPTLGGRTVPIRDWLNLAGRDNKVPMAFLFGDGDKTGASFAANCLKDLKAGGKNPLKLSADKSIDKGGKLLGHSLLNQDLPTQSLIVKYAVNVMEDRAAVEWDSREVDKSTYVWAFNPIQSAKREGDKNLNPLPLERLGIR